MPGLRSRLDVLLLALVVVAGCAQTSVKPGINEAYLDPDLDAADWTQRFEVESREIFAARRDIVEAVGLGTGMKVADIGAGTGLFTGPFAEAVGRSGTVYAVDIAPAFVAHVAERARQADLPQVEARLCREDSVELPPRSIDVAFTCDTYHHFEYPQSSLRSIHEALRPGGTLVVVDFERIPGVSRDWILDHVRAGKETVIEEIEREGFELVDEVEIDRLRENYFLRFRKRS